MSSIEMNKLIKINIGNKSFIKATKPVHIPLKSTKYFYDFNVDCMICETSLLRKYNPHLSEYKDLMVVDYKLCKIIGYIICGYFFNFSKIY